MTFSRSIRPVRTGAALAVGLVALVACGGGGDSDTAADTSTTAVAAVSVAPATTAEPTTEATSTPSTTSTVPDGPVMPLTGLPVADPTAATRPALVVKIDNGPPARPQTGLNLADIVYEENVEQITRFAAVYHTNLPDPVGPIRSGRTQDIELLGSLERPLFAWSGGNSRVTSAVRQSDLRDVGALTEYGPGGYFRSSSRSAPHNLYAQGSMLMSLAPEDASPPPAQFVYRDAGVASNGAEVDAIKLSMDGVRVEWGWDDVSQSFLRSQAGSAHVGSEGERISAVNVVALFVGYRASAADPRSPEAVTIGTGDAWVLTDGRLVEGTWSRADRSDPIALVDASGNDIGLTAGRTWVELVRRDKGAIVAAGVDPASVAFP